ncbi:MAG TPA: sialate O-acetylesterase [Candidatus Limiplasma sp.]|nr:sialate O-acetylesterase [Candidatus Limiplasma sp.]HRX07805.1 sialate O-acetylesterase [Candidatus Limiplasma sp.]
MEQSLQLAAVFTDHMVVSRNKNVRVFGAAADGQTVTVALAGQTAQAVASGGRFEAILAPMPAGGPHTMVVTAGESTLTFEDVMIGDVYLAGGQSNMEWALSQAEGGPELVKTLDNPMIRYVNFPHIAWLDEPALALERTMCWKPLKPGECGDVSAVACHFALELQPELNVPIGIIGCNWGGTSIVCWMDEDTLKQTTAGERLLDEYTQRVKDKSDEQYDAEMKAYDDTFQAWWKRVLAAQEQSPGISWSEINDTVGPGPWPQPEGRKSGFRPAGLAKTMLKRIAPYTLSGFLFYQGEEDTKHPHLYRHLLMTMIAFWRDVFLDASLPFLNCQLPMYIGKGEEDVRNWPPLRRAQEQVFADMRNTGLAVLIDCGEFDNIHPKDKKTVGHRLYLQALKVAYGCDIDADSPRALNKRRQGGALIVSLSAPVRVSGEASLFEVAGEDGVFHPAQCEVQGQELRVYSKAVPVPLCVRYAWVNYGTVHLFGENGLPLAPFML